MDKTYHYSLRSHGPKVISVRKKLNISRIVLNNFLERNSKMIVEDTGKLMVKI